MATLIEIFRKSCNLLLELMYIGMVKDGSEGHTQKDKDIISYKNGYNLEIHQLVDNIFDFKEEISANYGHKFVEAKISDELFNIKLSQKQDNSDEIDNIFKKLIEELERKNRYLVPEIISNLEVETELEIGNVKLIPFSEEKYKTLFKSKGVKDMLLLDLRDYSQGIYSIAVTEVEAGESNKAVDKADEIIDEVLNVIRIFDISHNFGIEGKHNGGWTYSVDVLNLDTIGISHSSGWIGRTVSAYFSKKIYDYLVANAGLKNIDNILRKPEEQRTNLEKKLLRAIKWAAEIVQNRDKQDSIIRLFAAFETLLTKDRNEEKRKNVTERVALINYQNLDGRQIVKEVLEKLYSSRNALIHEGATEYKEIEFNTGVIELIHIISIIAKNIDKYPNFEDWIKMVEKAKFSTKLEFQSSN